MRLHSVDKPKKFHISHLLLLSLGGGALLLGIGLLASPEGQLQIRMSILDNSPPAAVADLTAHDTVDNGQVLLSWTAPVEDGAVFTNPGAVSSYIVKYATFSVTSVGNDALFWWSVATSASGVPTPAVPGSLENMVLNLTPGTVYWFSLRSVDDASNLSPMDTKATTPGQQANALTRGTDSLPPAPVRGIAVSSTPLGDLISWSPLLINNDGTPLSDLMSYRVYRSTVVLGGDLTLIGTVSKSATLAFPLATQPLANAYFYILAVDQSGNESPLIGSNGVRVENRVVQDQTVVSNETVDSRATISEDLIRELKNDASDYLLRVVRLEDPEVTSGLLQTLANYRLELERPDGTIDSGKFVFSRPEMKIVLSYARSSLSVTGGGPRRASSNSLQSAGNGSVGVLWWNGVAWIKIGNGTVDSDNETVTFESSHLGLYRVQEYNPASSLSLDKAQVYPRIFSPNGDGVNDRVVFAVENPNLVSVTGRILDMSGAEVASIHQGGEGLEAQWLSWDGRDRSGHVVTGGVYVYEIQGDGKKISGTVVVAR